MTADVLIARFTASVVLAAMFTANLAVLNILPAFADEPSCARSPGAPQLAAAGKQPSAATPKSTQTAFKDAGQLIASLQSGRYDVPRVELAARLTAAGFVATDEYQRMRESAARELAGRPDGVGDVSTDELRKADTAIARQIKIDDGTMPHPTFAELARLPGRPQIEGLNIIYLNPLGDPAHANAWKNIIVHQTEGPPGSARREATDQFANPAKRGVTIWVETDGTVYWSTAETVIPTHTDGADRDDNKYIDNSTTYHAVVKTNSIGVEFIGNYPDVAKPVTPAQVQAWLLLAPFLQERYGIPPDHIYAHNWIDFKDQRYCEGCELATLARKLGYCPSNYGADAH
jgi:N-acetylmuramoyl-L-alanine amidase